MNEDLYDLGLWLPVLTGCAFAFFSFKVLSGLREPRLVG